MAGRRPAWGAGTPSRDAIAEAALRIVDSDGLDELSIRKLAAELGIHPTALYRRVADRDEILDLVANAVLAEIDLHVLRGSWSEQLLQLAMEFRATVERHPNAASLLNSWTTAQEPMAGVSEVAFSNLSSTGLQGRALLESYNAYFGYVLGASVIEALGRTGPERAASSRRVDPALWGRHPQLEAAATQFAELVASTPEAELRAGIFRAGVETLLIGIQARYGHR